MQFRKKDLLGIKQLELEEIELVLETAETALALMRSRYTAYCVGDAAYLRRTWHPDTRPERIALEPDRRWLGLRIVATSGGEAGDATGTVEFVARFKIGGRATRMREHSRFVFEDGCWYYVGESRGRGESRGQIS